mgnify:CR=1 FL=1
MMSDNDSLRFDRDSLETDIDFASPLRRVSYQAGMLLGVEATESEQDYHRRRLIRHQYWFNGYGTLLGMAVTVQGDEAKIDEQDNSLSVHVSPGIGIDGLGRELMVHEPYCINLSDWLASKTAVELASGINRSADNDLRLLISIRYQDTASGLQPTMATALNDSTDPVSPSRIKDCILLDIVATRDDIKTKPWLAHELDLNDSQDEKFTDLEQIELDKLAANDKDLMTQQARLVYALTKDADAQNQPDLSSTEIAEKVALIALAELRISDVDDLENLTEKLNLQHISINNLIRPFIQSNAQIANRRAT